MISQKHADIAISSAAIKVLACLEAPLVVVVEVGVAGVVVMIGLPLVVADSTSSSEAFFAPSKAGCPGRTHAPS
jgi:hypothetical protein